MKRKRLPVIFYLLSASLLANFADSLFGPLYAVFVQGIGGEMVDIGNTVALYSIITGVLILFIGKMSDRYSKELFVTGGMVISALATIGYLFVKNTFQLYLLQIPFALSTALITAPFAALFSQHIDKKHAGLLWAIDGGGGKILFGLGLMVGTYLTYLFGFRVIFLSIAGLQFLSAVLLLRVFFIRKPSTI